MIRSISNSVFDLLRGQCNVLEPSDVKKAATTLKRAIKVVGTPAYAEMVKNCMAQDLSWKVRNHRASNTYHSTTKSKL